MPTTSVRATFDMSEIGQELDGIPITDSNSIFANISRLGENNKNYNPFITLEHNVNILDGTLETFDLSKYDLSYFSKTLSNDNLETDNEIEINFQVFHTVYGLMLDFGVNSFLGDVEITYYRNNEFLSTYNLTPKFADTAANIGETNFNKIKLKFKTTKFPRMFSRLQYFSLGEVFNWGSDDIISCNIVENINPISKEVAINTCELSVYSSENSFSMLNPNGPFKYLRKNQRFKIFATYDGTEYEFGTFFLDTWDTTTHNIAKFNLISPIGLLSNITYYDAHFLDPPIKSSNIGDTVYQTLNEIFDHYIVFVEQIIDYNVSNELANTPLCGYLPLTSYKNIVQIITFVACAIVDDTRDGIIKVKRILDNPSSRTITLNQIFDKVTIRKNELPTKIKINYYVTDFEQEESENWKELYNGELKVNETKRIYSNDPMVSVYYKKIEGDKDDDDISRYTQIRNHATYYVDFTPPSSGNYILKYSQYDHYNHPEVYDLTNETNKLSENIIELENEPLIFNGSYIDVGNSGNYAEFLGNIKKYYNSVPFMAEFEFINDGTVKTGDVVTIETEYQKKLKGYIIEQNINLSGGLISKAKLIGDVVDES